MYKKLLICGIAVAAVAAVSWNGYRLWTKPETPAPMQVHVEPEILGISVLVTRSPQDEPAIVEDDCEAAAVIDLTCLLTQTAEPLPAQTEEPSELPMPAAKSSKMPSHGVVVTQFLPHSADGDEARPMKATWIRLASYLFGERASAVVVPEPLALMPRPYVEPYRCPQATGCPYHGGATHPNYHHPIDVPMKLPKLDTMDLRPGDLPTVWFIKPF